MPRRPLLLATASCCFRLLVSGAPAEGAAAVIAGFEPLPETIAVAAASSPPAPDRAGGARHDATGPTPADGVRDSLVVEAGTDPRARSLAAGHRLVRNIGSDVGYVLAFPARLNRKGLTYAVCFLAAGATLYAFDQEIADAFHRSRGAPVYDAVIGVGEEIQDAGHMGRTNPWYLGGAAIATALRIEPLQRFTYDVLESHLISGGIRNASRFVIGRRRQHEGRGPRHFEWNGGTSLPSGHTSTAFGLATMISHHTGSTPIGALAYGLAGTIALQRVASKAHWPSDVLLSAAQGVVIARVVIRRNAERRARVTSLIGATPDGRGVMMTLRF